MVKIKLFFVLVVFSIALPGDIVIAQEKKEKEEKEENVFLHPDKFYRKFFPHLRIRRNPPDSQYIRLYQNFLSVGVHVLSPVIRIGIDSKKSIPPGIDPSLKLRTNISDIVGFSVGYRFVSAGFAYLLKSGLNTHNDYAASHYRTATIKYSGSAFSFQFKYVRIKGFTDVNTFNRIDLYQKYRQRPDMLSKDFQFEGIYNLSWKKYSYIAPLTFAQRQIKSHAGFLLKAGIYYNQLSGDSALIGHKQQIYYDDFNGVKIIRSLSLRLAPGVGGNLVFYKQFYMSLAAFTSFDFYNYKYLKAADEKVHARQTAVFLLDGKASLGYQSRRLFMGLRYEAERRIGSLHHIQTNTIYSYTGIELGYRFNAPHIIKKIYKKTMPPGM